MVTRTDGYSFLLGAGSLSIQTREDVARICTAMANPRGSDGEAVEAPLNSKHIKIV